MIKPDIKARITLTGRNFVASGYRPAHLINGYLTTGLHNYLGCELLEKGQTVDGTITFITPEEYPNSITVGMRIVFQEGAMITGFAEVIEIYNEKLKQQNL